jgi:hypothetical protein
MVPIAEASGGVAHSRSTLAMCDTSETAVWIYPSHVCRRYPHRLEISPIDLHHNPLVVS